MRFACTALRQPLGTVLAFLLSTIVLAGCNSGSSDPMKFNYVALGDSVAFGRGGTNDTGYVHYFRDYLQTAQPREVVLDKQALLIVRSGDLLFQLRENLPVGAREAVRGAHLLTIHIGGNNLLQCANADYTALDQGCAAQGVTDFQNDWPRILQEIRQSIGSQAPLIVATVYNPFQGDDPQYATADTYIRQINTIIQNPATEATYNYKVADVYTHFMGRLPNGMWKVCAWTHFCEANRDVHPTDAGHHEIATLHQPLYP
jgi:lysophospholipase L1-like esterase